MFDWTSGYVADVDYSFGYYTELNPLRMRLALLNVFWAPPPCSVACELGYGQGVSVNVHAAASNIEWRGTDFNPGHASFARDLQVRPRWRAGRVRIVTVRARERLHRKQAEAEQQRRQVHAEHARLYYASLVLATRRARIAAD